MATHIYRQRVVTAPEGRRQIYEERVSEDTGVAQQAAVSRYSGIGILYAILDLVEILLAARLILRLLAANPGNAFVSFMYQISSPFVAPFRSALAPTVTQGTVIEWATILAMIVYAIVVYAIVRLLTAPSRPATRV